MLVLIQRPPLPDAQPWTGRRGLAALDAVAWPAGWLLALLHTPAPVGVFGRVLVAFILLCAIHRLHRALWMNHRYRFTTWRWGKLVAVLMLTGWLLKTLQP